MAGLKDIMEYQERTADAARQGTLDMLLPMTGEPKKWCSRYCILYGVSARNQPRFDWYATEAEHRNGVCLHEAVYMEQVMKMEIPFPLTPDENSYVFDLKLDKGRRLSLSTGSKENFNEWLHCFRRVKAEQQIDALKPPSPLESTIPEYEIPFGDNYDVAIVQTDAAKRNALPLKGQLAIGLYGIVLQSVDKRPLVEWKFGHIRRYGSDSGSFSLECGRKCQTGPGLFSFQTKIDGSTLMANVKRRIETMKQSHQKNTQMNSYTALGSQTPI